MQSPILSPILAAVISLTSVIITIIIQHFLEINKIKHQLKNYPTTIIYNKQLDFFDKISQEMIGILIDVTTRIEINKDKDNYITKNMQALRDKLLLHTDNIHKISIQYFLFIPAKMSSSISGFMNSCYDLMSELTYDKSKVCLAKYNELASEIRKCIGIDEISEDLISSFNVGRPKIKK